jgi:hypothetical protein
MKNQIIPYNPKLKLLARSLRKEIALSEIILLWHQISKRQI